MVKTDDNPPFDFLIRDYAGRFPFNYEPLHRFNLGIYLTPPEAPIQDALKRWLRLHFPHPPSDTLAWLSALNQTIYRTLVYRRRDEPGIQTPLETIAPKGFGAAPVLRQHRV